VSESPYIAVVVPVYDQPHRLREVVERCLAVRARVLVVDDGSAEPVARLLEDLPVTVLRHEVNRGKGEALQTAARFLRAQGATHMVSLDADGQHYPEDLPRFWDAVAKDPEALILGVRDFDQADVPGCSRFGRAFGNFWVWVQTGRRVPDIQSGFRAYPLRLFERLHCLTRRYGFEVEMVVRTLWAGARVVPVNVRVFYPPAGQRCSHFHKVRDNVRVSLLNTHLTLRALVPWPHRQLGEAAAKVTVWHPFRSIRALVAERATPRELGLAVALGVFLGALPLIAMHTLAVLIAAALMRLNRVVSLAASQLCMPPVVPALCIEVGYFMRYGRFLSLQGVHHLRDASFLELGYMGLQRLWDWLLGSLVVGPALALGLGLCTVVIARVLERGRRASRA